jgi:hypothetical protein
MNGNRPPRFPSDARPYRFRPVRLRAPRRAARPWHHPAAAGAARADRATPHLVEGAGGWLRTLLGEASGNWRLAQIVEPAQLLTGLGELAAHAETLIKVDKLDYCSARSFLILYKEIEFSEKPLYLGKS